VRAILDTHVFLWWNTDDSRLSPAAHDLIADGGNTLLLSAASAWEIAIKYARGRLILPEAPPRYVASRMEQHHIEPLPIQLAHALHVHDLPHYHSDPFDRLLVAQSQLERIPIVTGDAHMARYDITVVW